MIRADLLGKLGAPIKSNEEISINDLIFFNNIIKYWRHEPSLITDDMAKNFPTYYVGESASFSLQDAINHLVGIREVIIDDLDDGSLSRDTRGYLCIQSTYYNYWSSTVPRRTFYFA